MRHLGLLVLLHLVGACSKSEDASPDLAPRAEPKPTKAVSAEVPPPPPEPSPLERLMAQPTLAEAIDYVRPQMSDTDDETSPGAALLAFWSAKHLTWRDIAVGKNETSFALVRKDSDASRGKRMCVRGRIIQIQKDKLTDGAVFSGLLLIGYSDIVSFIAAGSTGDLVQHSRARFCGVVIGTYDYSNSGGGKGHAVSLVGMFDLPENRTPTAP